MARDTIDIPVELVVSVVESLTNEQLGKLVRSVYRGQAEQIGSALSISISFKAEKRASARKVFEKPDIEDVKRYFVDNGSTIQEAEIFYCRYDSVGWRVGTNKMEKWRSAASGWIRRNYNNKTEQNNGHSTKFKRQVDAQREFGAALAQRSAELFAEESSGRSEGESGDMPEYLL